MKLARALTVVLWALSLLAPSARADSVAPAPPVIEKAGSYAYSVHVEGSSDPMTTGVLIYAGATCDLARDPDQRYYLGMLAPGIDGRWAGNPYRADRDSVLVAVGHGSSGRSSEPSACVTADPPPEVAAPASQTVDDRTGSVHVVLTRSSSDGSSEVRYDTVAGTAHEDADYYPAHGYAAFAPGESTTTVSIDLSRTPRPINTSRTFELRLSSAAGGTVGERSTTKLTIEGTDPPPKSQVGVGDHLTNFGTVATSNAPGRTTHVTIYSHGRAPLIIKRVALVGSPAFDIPRNACRVGATIDGRHGCNIFVRFRPKTQGRVDTTLIVESSARTLSIPYFGTGGRVGYACTNDYEYPSRRDPRNPLMLRNHSRTSRDPLTGAKFFVDSESGLGIADLKRLRRQKRFREARLLERITSQPETKRFSRFTRTGGYRSVRQLMCRVPVQQQGSIPLLSLYRLEHEHCGNHNGDSRKEQAAYRGFVDDFVRGVGRFPVVVFYEFDSLITTPCLNSHGLAVRLAELRYGVKKLSKLPHAVVYLDGGAADALPYRRTASLLNRVGLRSIQGFFLNSTHYDWTHNEIAYGRKISRLVGGKHFVVSTAVNGRGPLRPRDRRQGNSVLCNPPGRGLGTRPTTHTGNSLVDAFAWIGNPGRSGGRCHRGDAQNGYWDLRYALSLARYARF